MRDINIFRVSGRIDSATAPAFWQGVSEELKNGATKFIIDCENLEFLSSAGLRSILGIAKHIKPQNGLVSMCNMNQQTKAVIDIAGISAFIKLYGDLADALSHY